MRFLKRHFTLMAILVCLVSCGKKAQVKAPGTMKSETQATEVEAYLIKDLKNALIENEVETVKKIVNDNETLNLNQIVPGTGETLLTLSIIKDHKEIRNFLLEKGASPEALNALQQTPLFVAVKNQQLNSVQVLVDLKVNLDQIDFHTKDTALHLAIKNSYSEIALLLIKEGAGLEILDRHYRAPIHLAEENKLTAVAEVIRTILQTDHGAPDIKSFKTLLKEADLPRLHSVLSRYPRLVNDYEVINPLAILVEGKNELNSLRSAELLIKYEANVNGPIDADQTPLIKATKGQKRGFADLFLRSKANPQLLDTEGKSALIHAIEANNLELVDLLLSFSAVEKYTFRRDGKKITYSACETARDVSKRLTDENAKITNRDIRKSLGCGLLIWSF